MKKIITITILLIIISSMLLNMVCATNINITEDNFKEALNEVIGDQNNTSSKMDKENKTITFLARNIVINYDLNNNPTFTTELNFSSQMTQEECNNEQQNISVFLSLFQTVSNYFKIDKNSALSYYVKKTESEEDIKNLMNIDRYPYQKTFTNAMKFAKDLLDKDINFSDTLFTIQTKKIEETSDNYKARVTLIVNIGADFSILNNYSGSLENTILGSAHNAIDKYEKAQKEEEQMLQDVQNYINDISENQSMQSAGKLKLPQTGYNIIFIIMVAIICTVAISISFFKYKNIDK